MCQNNVTWLHIYNLHPDHLPSQIFFFGPQGGVVVEDCDVVPNAGTSMWTARVLSIVVKNMQSYIVAVVWGVAEVLLFLRKSKGDKYSTHKKGAPIKGESSLISSASVAVEN